MKTVRYVKKDVQRAFDYLKICADDLQVTGFRYEEYNNNPEHTKKREVEAIWNARVKVIEAIEELAKAQ